MAAITKLSTDELNKALDNEQEKLNKAVGNYDTTLLEKITAELDAREYDSSDPAAYDQHTDARD